MGCKELGKGEVELIKEGGSYQCGWVFKWNRKYKLHDLGF